MHLLSVALSPLVLVFISVPENVMVQTCWLENFCVGTKLWFCMCITQILWFLFLVNPVSCKCFCTLRLIYIVAVVQNVRQDYQKQKRTDGFVWSAASGVQMRTKMKYVLMPKVVANRRLQEWPSHFLFEVKFRHLFLESWGVEYLDLRTPSGSETRLWAALPGPLYD